MWALWEAAFHWWDGGRHQLSELFIGHVSCGKPSPSFQSGQSLAFLSSFCCINYLDICQNTLPVVSKNYLILWLLYGLRSARSTQARVYVRLQEEHTCSDDQGVTCSTTWKEQWISGCSLQWWTEPAAECCKSLLSHRCCCHVQLRTHGAPCIHFPFLASNPGGLRFCSI